MSCPDWPSCASESKRTRVSGFGILPGAPSQSRQWLAPPATVSWRTRSVISRDGSTPTSSRMTRWYDAYWRSASARLPSER